MVRYMVHLQTNLERAEVMIDTKLEVSGVLCSRDSGGSRGDDDGRVSTASASENRNEPDVLFWAWYGLYNSKASKFAG